jgi:hypothetical protein
VYLVKDVGSDVIGQIDECSHSVRTVGGGDG